MNIKKLKELDRITEQRIVDKRLVSAAYAVAYDNEIIFKNAIGYADIENKIPLKSDPVMRLASMTKHRKLISEPSHVRQNRRTRSKRRGTRLGSEMRRNGLKIGLF